VGLGTNGDGGAVGIGTDVGLRFGDGSGAGVLMLGTEGSPPAGIREGGSGVDGLPGSSGIS
jgi:hypothetical protein